MEVPPRPGILDSEANKPSIIVVNKIDLDNKLKLPYIDKKVIEISVKDDIGYIYGFGSDLAKYGPDLRGKVFEFKLSALKDKESQEYLSSIRTISYVINVVSHAVLSSSKNI